jgi:hypothetical protein
MMMSFFAAQRNKQRAQACVWSPVESGRTLTLDDVLHGVSSIVRQLSHEVARREER